ncbi:hypothetical protein GTY23_41490 [Streptomyces sp. SID5998]|nr:hypothetical protein [Streptomyces sp. SID5998]
MPRIRVLEGIAGADFSWAPGDVVEVTDEEAASWADGYRAVLATEQDGPPAADGAAASHLLPVVVGEDGQPLEVLNADLEETDPPEGADGGTSWVRWSVTVRLPVPAAGGGQAPEDEDEADPADLENTVPEQDVFDPCEHTNRQVLAYLDTVGEQEALRVFAAEAAGENRAGIAKMRDQVLEAARRRDGAAGGTQSEAEKAADYSRGGGGEPAPETRDW